MNAASTRVRHPRLHYRLLTLCPAPTDPVPRGQLWPTGPMYSQRAAGRLGQAVKRRQAQGSLRALARALAG